MNVNPHPVPGGPIVDADPPMTTTCVITWQDGARLEAHLRSSYSNEEGRVTWTGSVHQIAPPPVTCDACLLTFFLRDQAEKTGGRLVVRYDGVWLPQDQVKA